MPCIAASTEHRLLVCPPWRIPCPTTTKRGMDVHTSKTTSGAFVCTKGVGSGSRVLSPRGPCGDRSPEFSLRATAPSIPFSSATRRRRSKKKNLNCNKGFLHRQFFLFLRVFPLHEVFPRSPPWPCRTRRDLHSAWVSLRAPRELQGIQVPPTVRSSSKARSSEARTQTQRRSARLFGASTRASSKSAG